MPDEMRQLMRYGSLLATGAAAGWLFDLARIPVAWLLGPLVVGVVASGLNGAPQSIHPGLQIVGQVVLGLSSGVGFPLQTLLTVGALTVPVLLTIVASGVLSLLNGYLLWRWAGVDRATGFMGSLPGAASSMVAMSDEVGADAMAVAILQYLRLLLVVFLAPLAVSYAFPAAGAPAGAGGTAAAGLPTAPLAADLLLLTMAGAIGAWAAPILRIPSPTFLGPFLLALAVSWTLPYQFFVPAPVFSAGMVLVGLSIGARFDVTTARKLGKVALIETVLVVILIGLCLVVGYVFHLATGVDVLTAVLGSTPGGLEVMVASAVQLGGDAGLVLAMQMIRWFVILLAGPWVTLRLVQRR